MALDPARRRRNLPTGDESPNSNLPRATKTTMLTSSEVVSYQGNQRHDPRLSGVDENSQSGTSFPEGGTSLEDAIKPHANGPPHRRQQVEPAVVELGGTQPELPPPGPMDVRLLPIHTHGHLP